MTSSPTSGRSVSVDALRERVKGLMPQAWEDLSRAVSFRSVADGTEPVECERMAEWTVEAFSGVGVRDVLAHETADGSKTVCGHVPGPPEAPTILLYFHHDVQPASDDGWESPPWELTARSDRWYGRGAADCKGSLAAHLTALRALGPEPPVTVKIVGEGSEEQGTGGLERFVPKHTDLLRADAILVCDTGNVAVGVPTLTASLRGMARVWVTVRTLSSPVHSGMYGGAAPDALVALIHMLATLRDETGATTVRGLESEQSWAGAAYPAEQFRKDAGVLEGVDVLGAEVADMLWARPAATVLGIDCPPVVGSSAAVPHEARARIDLRIPPGVDAKEAQSKLIEHFEAVAPWHVQLTFEREATGEPFKGATEGPGFEAMAGAMRDAYGRDITLQGQGGSIPLCTVLQETFPDAEIMLLGVEEPMCLIHAANESVDPSEIENIALAEALFMQKYAEAKAS
jgi:cysteinylglycine-S-conjugate dipeptidase